MWPQGKGACCVSSTSRQSREGALALPITILQIDSLERSVDVHKVSELLLGTAETGPQLCLLLSCSGQMVKKVLCSRGGGESS